MTYDVERLRAGLRREERYWTTQADNYIAYARDGRMDRDEYEDAVSEVIERLESIRAALNGAAP